MIVTIFNILGLMYLIQLYFFEDFNPVGKEFTGLVILGFYILLQKK
jgi:hypothetical protein